MWSWISARLAFVMAFSTACICWAISRHGLPASIISITALDYLNFGLPKPTPSWGELLAQGTDNLHASWIVSSAFVAMVVVLTLVTFIGEAVREAFDPKKYTVYK